MRFLLVMMLVGCLGGDDKEPELDYPLCGDVPECEEACQESGFTLIEICLCPVSYQTEPVACLVEQK